VQALYETTEPTFSLSLFIFRLSMRSLLMHGLRCPSFATVGQFVCLARHEILVHDFLTVRLRCFFKTSELCHYFTDCPRVDLPLVITLVLMCLKEVVVGQEGRKHVHLAFVGAVHEH
jgi:hypothetical protein